MEAPAASPRTGGRHHSRERTIRLPAAPWRAAGQRSDTSVDPVGSVANAARSERHHTGRP